MMTINTDNMTVSDTYITTRISAACRCILHLGMQIKEFLYHAAEASFTTEDIKQRPKARIYIYDFKRYKGKFIVYALCCDRKGEDNMVLAMPIYDSINRVLLATGTIMTRDYIRKLKARGGCGFLCGKMNLQRH